MISTSLLHRIPNKIIREVYRFSHPCLWGKRLQINGVPEITNLRQVDFGMFASINSEVFIQSTAKVSIGERVTLSRGVHIFTEGLDTSQYIENAQKEYRAHVSNGVCIGSGTWIAAGVIICPGVKIAKNCIVAAGAVVVNDLSDEGCLYGGVPAIKIKEICA